MGFEGLSLFEAPPVFITLVNEGLLTRPTFGLLLADPNPRLVVGGRDANLYDGDLKFVPVDTPVRISQRCLLPLF